MSHKIENILCIHILYAFDMSGLKELIRKVLSTFLSQLKLLQQNTTAWGPRNRHLLPHSSGGWVSETRVPAPALARALLLACRWQPPLLCLHAVNGEEVLVPS